MSKDSDLSFRAKQRMCSGVVSQQPPTPRETKNGKDGDIPMNVEVRAALVELCKNESSDAYLSQIGTT